MKILLDKSRIALRKTKRNNIGLTAGQLKQHGSLERIVHLDEDLRALRGSWSPPYFEKAKKRSFCNDKTIGSCTIVL